MARHRVVGIDFDHMHMGDLLRLVCDHPDAEVVGVWHTDRDKPTDVLRRLELPEALIYDDWQRLLQECEPTAAVLCAATASHCQWAQRILDRKLHLLVEKPFASTVEEADAMIRSAEASGMQLAINWPLFWYPSHRTAKRLIDENTIGKVVNIHYYDGNRGPAHHKMDKIEVDGEELLREKQQSWFYRQASGGGSLLDYLGYGVTLATWFNGGDVPREVTSVVDQPHGLEVDEHSVTVCVYERGVSKFETRWGTFSDPWTHQPQPKCGFVICGTDGTLSSYDFEDSVRLQTRDCPEGFEVPVDKLVSPVSDPITYFLHCIEHDEQIEGPLSPEISRIGQQIVDTACASAAQKRTLPLVGTSR